jgi:hypothetical protein
VVTTRLSSTTMNSATDTIANVQPGRRFCCECSLGMVVSIHSLP